jgi:hypothetical protein
VFLGEKNMKKVARGKLKFEVLQTDKRWENKAKT